MKTQKLRTPKNWRTLEPHPLADLVKFGAGIDIDALANYLREHGYDEQEPIVLHEGRILDGRHRHAAAIKAGVIPKFRAFVGKNAFLYVAKKLHRQHLSTSERAMMAATLANRDCANLHNKPPTQSQMAEVLNVSLRSVADAAKVQDQGTKALNDAVADGTLTVSDAAAIAQSDSRIQDRAVNDVRAGKADTAKEAAFIFCERCRRVGPVRDCQTCARLGSRAPEPKKKKSGDVLFDWREFDKHFGIVMRYPDRIADVWPSEKSGPEFDSMSRLLDQVASLDKKWREKLKKLPHPKRADAE